MASFLRNTLLYFLLILTVLSIFDYIVTSGLRKTDYAKFAKLNDIFQGKIDSDILIMGGSDAGQHFSPSILDSILQTSTYNLGLPGHNFYLQYALFENYLKVRNNKYPKVIIQAVNINTFGRRKDFYAYKSFLPYLNSHNISEYTQHYNGLGWADYYLPFVRYSGELELIKIGIYEFFTIKQYSNDLYKGYASFDRPWNESALNSYKETYPRKARPREEIIKLFDNYLADAKKNGTEVYLIQSPYFIEAQNVNINWKEISVIYEELANKYGFLYYDYSTDSLSYDKNNFYDYGHLNQSNSHKFSIMVANKLKSNQGNTL